MKVLFLAHAFPPANAPATPRNWNIARALAENGSVVRAVTLRADAWKRVDREVAVAPPRLMRIDVPPRFTFLHPWLLRASDKPIPAFLGGIARFTARKIGIDPWIGWRMEVEKATARLTPADVDVVLATGSPFVSFDVARRLAKRLGKPFVLDYRDLWHQNPHAHHNREVDLEEEILAEAAAVIAVSPSLLAVLDREYGIGAKGHVLTNGFDDEEMKSVVPETFDDFAIVYTGQFYPPARVPEPLLTALARLRIPNWKFHYAGPHGEMVRAAAEAVGVTDRVVLHGNVSRHRSLELVAGAGVGVVITTVESTADDAERGIVTSKIFDIIGLQRPMLVIAPPGSDVETIVAGRSQTACLPAAEQERIAAFVESVAAEPTPATPMPQFSWRGRSGIVRSILESAVRVQPS